ncbi:hypothetical protein [Actinoplanes derwentensis]|uniref:Uncharacterized protein n=1 Tax=Actinoplanes derwentensis TaxID=113562 RepID=A0A1H2DBQ3_9ACTN|nr:hypothetical protein [Actinoplanes derwentensis]GID87515.1 hypothetical protein Ade03nite_64390 [Actinoplanes derwentensis]SDT80185.1 hypothetical protein SAMN04489716_9099 [Actinoplanes derwentensis]
MIATLLAHAGHVAPASGTEAPIGVALLLTGAATALWRSRNQTVTQQDIDTSTSTGRPAFPCSARSRNSP